LAIARSERPRPKTLLAEASGSLRSQLLCELKQQGNAEAISSWAQRALPLKNQLSADDARAVEGAFTGRLSQLEGEPDAFEGQEVNGRNDRSYLNKRVTVINKPVHERDRHHLKFVASRPCLICGRAPSDAHHVKFAEQRAMGRKVSDRFTVPVCRIHHRELHRGGNERFWWESQGIDPLRTAATLWGKTHPATGNDSTTHGDPGISGSLNGRVFGQVRLGREAE
jgi:hypothetical protein